MSDDTRSHAGPSLSAWLTSAVASAAALVLLVVALPESERGHYLAVAGLAGAVLLVHGPGWWLAFRRGRTWLAWALIGGAQLVAIALAPLFLADVWTVGLLLMAAVPLGVGTGDDPRRIPTITFAALLAGAGMVVLDLNAPASRPAPLDGSTWVGTAITVAALTRLAVDGLLLWWVRLRRGSARHRPLDLATQLTLVFVVVLVASLVVVSGVLIRRTQASLTRDAGENVQTVSQVIADRAAGVLDRLMGSPLDLAEREPTILKGVTDANAAYPTEAPQLAALQERGDRD